MFKAHITDNGKRWGESIWIMVDEPTGRNIEDLDKYNFIAEAKNDAITAPIKYGHKYKFKLKDGHIWILYPYEEVSVATINVKKYDKE